MWKKIDIFLILLFGVSIIFYKFNHIPAHLAFDEIEFAKLALSLDGQNYTPYSTLAIGHSTLYFYVILLSFKLFGITAFALRLPSAVFGILSPIIFYLIIKSVLNSKSLKLQPTIFYMPLALIIIFIAQRWYFNFARFAFEGTFLLLLELVSLYFLVSYLNNKKMQEIVLSAIFAGLAFHSYTPGRIFFLISLIMLIMYDRKSIPKYIIIVSIIISPLLIYFQNNPDIRVKEKAVLLDASLTIQDKLQQVGKNIYKSGSMLYKNGDMNGRHNFPGKPALNPIVGLLFIAGLAFSLKEFSNKYHKLFLICLVISFIPSWLTYASENPHMLRTITAIPAVVYFSGITLIKINELFVNKKIISFTMIFLIILSSVIIDLRTYFQFQSRVARNAFEITCNLKEALSFKANKLRDIPEKCRVTEDLF